MGKNGVRQLDWRDLACLPWWFWIVGLILGRVERAPNVIDGAIPMLLIAVAAAPAFMMVWIVRRAWLVRRGWWIAFLLMAAGAVLFAPDS